MTLDPIQLLRASFRGIAPLVAVRSKEETEIEADYQGSVSLAHSKANISVAEIMNFHDKSNLAAKELHDRAIDEAKRVCDAAVQTANRVYETEIATLDGAVRKANFAKGRARDFLSSHGIDEPTGAVPAAPRAADVSMKGLKACVSDAENGLAELEDHFLWSIHGKNYPTAALAIGGVGLLLGGLVTLLCLIHSRGASVCCETLVIVLFGAYTGLAITTNVKLVRHVDVVMPRIKAAASRAVAICKVLSKPIEARKQSAHEKSDKQKRVAIAQTEEVYRLPLAANDKRRDEDLAKVQQRKVAEMQSAESLRQCALTAAAKRWHFGYDSLRAELNRVRTECARFFPGWAAVDWQKWRAPNDLPFAVPFGQIGIDNGLLPNGHSSDARFSVQNKPLGPAPALVPFPSRPSLLLKTDEKGKLLAIKCLQSVMLRVLTELPPGKVRFTIFDPVGVGDNFAIFMNLADHDAALVTSQIWMKQSDIASQLEKLSDHMAAVNQKYLRGKYKDIEEYNAKAGEVAEPYRILVVADFPTNFSNDAAKSLLSIASVGSRCGVYVLLMLDTTKKLPHDFNLKELEQHFVCLTWGESHFIWRDPDFQAWPLALDEPPSPDRFIDILNHVGRTAKEGNWVKVPFSFIAPSAATRWSASSREGINVPIGRAGATKRQCFELGKDTAHHALVVGKTGSGKSTLFHALITNLALTYSPWEIELYLIDFKKGVEFKTYAANELPHARVVAIESEAEFGLSILERLDRELTLRGKLFRDCNVPNIQEYRLSKPGERMPRILLIVDEFQEFFAEDDSMSLQAARYIERLVKQARAFGIHVILGSQSLSGRAALHRNIIDQMGVRIALQTSDSESREVMDKGNDMARLLSRPGEAIYNNQNGLKEGNDLFQVVWLPENERDVELKHVRAMATARKYVSSQPQLVFEGSVPSDLEKNHLLRGMLTSPNSSPTSNIWKAWLGESISIKDPTCAVFRPQAESNMLVVGLPEDAGCGIIAAAAISLAAHQRHTKSANPFVVLDGTAEDSPFAGMLSRLTSLLPTPPRLFGRRQEGAAIDEVHAELIRRTTSGANSHHLPLFLFVHGLQFFREIRKDDPLAGYGSPAPVTVSKKFLTILRDGPAMSVHTIVWCDTVANLDRAFDRRVVLREFASRVALRMGDADSNAILGSNHAGRLGSCRAYFQHEDEPGHLEKFRPYHHPTDSAWIQWVKSCLT